MKTKVFAWFAAIAMSVFFVLDGLRLFPLSQIYQIVLLVVFLATVVFLVRKCEYIVGFMFFLFYLSMRDETWPVSVRILIVLALGFSICTFSLFLENINLRRENKEKDKELKKVKDDTKALREQKFYLQHQGEEIVVDDFGTGALLGYVPKMTVEWSELVCPVLKISEDGAELIGAVVKQRGRFRDGGRGYGYWFGEEVVDVSVYNDAVDCRIEA